MLLNERKNYEIKNIFVSGLTIVNNRLNSDFMNAVNNILKLDYVKYGYSFIKNSNILSDDLWQDGLHSNSSGKGNLLNNFSYSVMKTTSLLSVNLLRT